MTAKWLILAVIVLILVSGIAFSIWQGVGRANQQVIDAMHTQQYEAGETAVQEFQLTQQAKD